jgi:hypothetical protein
MEQDELAPDLARQQGSVLVLGCPDQSHPLNAAEVLCGGQRDARSAGAERGIGDHPRLELRHPGEPRILDPPRLVEDARPRLEQRRFVDEPVREAVLRSSHRQVADPPTVFDPAQQHRGAFHLGGAGVQHGVDGVRPPVRRQQRVAAVTAEKVVADLTGRARHR